ncbi:ferritin-like domain-containing protein [Nocardioides jiangxiensis]|uniref:Ferritin-like domain-containing protein n=1 Tax=Nocardioides jiangxiensis TaxID=3064524 RepID=A0ABT9B300_9ACTN|nr:ferritin-like domain-containing protein [Nocardioides sp. WY-20]MDO7869231.1 ferritin-like domain-containing protein [Nocardioides sp. WY-20]
MSTEITPLQTAVAGEHAAVWVLGVIGAQAPEDSTLRDRVTDAFRVHRSQRDHLVARITALGGVAVPAEPGYTLGDVSSTSAAYAAALEVEQRAAAVYADLVAHATGSDRSWAVTALVECSIRQLRFRGSPEIFPGTSELANR